MTFLKHFQTDERTNTYNISKTQRFAKRSLGERKECAGTAAEPVPRSQHEVLSQENAAIPEQLIGQTKPRKFGRTASRLLTA
jgi:hypothetical protein